jgi:LPXTG-site transpeptidase (sortase) family protein
MVPEGVNDKGELEVPDGTTQNVGWYKDGASPGQVGSAVLDAHVFAAFSKLHNIKPGSDIYVVLQNNAQLHFMVQSVSTYELGQVPLEQLFNRADHERLNLITCAGRLTPDHTTYDHRLVIYATLVQ